MTGGPKIQPIADDSCGESSPPNRPPQVIWNGPNAPTNIRPKPVKDTHATSIIASFDRLGNATKSCITGARLEAEFQPFEASPLAFPFFFFFFQGWLVPGKTHVRFPPLTVVSRSLAGSQKQSQRPSRNYRRIGPKPRVLANHRAYPATAPITVFLLGKLLLTGPSLSASVGIHSTRVHFSGPRTPMCDPEETNPMKTNPESRATSGLHTVPFVTRPAPALRRR
jgi:hypothetical protein